MAFFFIFFPEASILEAPSRKNTHMLAVHPNPPVPRAIQQFSDSVTRVFRKKIVPSPVTFGGSLLNSVYTLTSPLTQVVNLKSPTASFQTSIYVTALPQSGTPVWTLNCQDLCTYEIHLDGERVPLTPSQGASINLTPVAGATLRLAASFKKYVIYAVGWTLSKSNAVSTTVPLYAGVATSVARVYNGGSSTSATLTSNGLLPLENIFISHVGSVNCTIGITVPSYTVQYIKRASTASGQSATFSSTAPVSTANSVLRVTVLPTLLLVETN